MRELTMSEIAKLMSEHLGSDVKEELITKLPDDGCPGHMGLPHWDVYAARAGEFTVVAQVFDDGRTAVTVI